MRPNSSCEITIYIPMDLGERAEILHAKLNQYCPGAKIELEKNAVVGRPTIARVFFYVSQLSLTASTPEDSLRAAHSRALHAIDEFLEATD